MILIFNHLGAMEKTKKKSQNGITFFRNLDNIQRK